jgi:pimeloyl-ACP methyl ester carboxylesterase
MATISSIITESHPNLIPESASEWLAYNGVDQQTIMVGDIPVSCGVFNSISPDTSETISIFAGGVPRNEQRWPVLPVINKFFGYVAAGLALEQTTGISFNWPGLGDTPGEIMRTSIDTRADFLVEFSKTMLDTFNAKRINFVGASMGAYCAAIAAERLPADSVHKQAFLSLPAYPESAHPLAYANGFRAEIQRDWSLDESPIYKLMANTATPSLVAYSEYDDPPIPRSIQDGFSAAASTNDNLTHRVIEGVYHNFRRTPDDMPGEAIDNESIRRFGSTLIKFLSE